MNYKLETTRNVDSLLTEIQNDSIYLDNGEMKLAIRRHLAGEELIKKMSVVRLNNKIVSWSAIVKNWGEYECWVYTDIGHRMKGLGRDCLKASRRGYHSLYFHRNCTPDFWRKVIKK